MLWAFLSGYAIYLSLCTTKKGATFSHPVISFFLRLIMKNPLDGNSCSENMPMNGMVLHSVETQTGRPNTVCVSIFFFWSMMSSQGPRKTCQEDHFCDQNLSLTELKVLSHVSVRLASSFFSLHLEFSLISRY